VLFIKDTSTVPPGEGWCYFVEATQKNICTKNINVLYPKIKTHCESNNVPVPSEADVTNQMCERLYIPCFEGRSALVNKFTLNLPPPLPKGCCGKQVQVTV
jgi:hypothetical protein